MKREQVNKIIEFGDLQALIKRRDFLIKQASAINKGKNKHKNWGKANKIIDEFTRLNEQILKIQNGEENS